MTVSKVLFSSKDQTWGTPPELFERISRSFGPFKLDAATNKYNSLETPYFYTEKENGLIQPWMNPTYCNPPYGKKLGEWIKKAYVESVLGNRAVMLIPARTDTKWFHQYIYNRPKVETIFLKGRLRMWDYNLDKPHPHSAPFPSMVVIFRP